MILLFYENYLAYKPEEETILVVNRTSKSIDLIFKILFFCMFLFSLLMGIYLANIRKNVSTNQRDRIVYIDKWKVIDHEGKTFNTGRKYDDIRAYTEIFTIVSDLPDTIYDDSILCFLNRSDASIFVNGEMRKDFKRTRDTGIPGGSMKDFYLSVPLKPSDAGGELRIIRNKTDWNPTVVPETFVTSNEGLYDYLVGKYGLTFLMSAILFVAALLVTIMGIVICFWKRHSIDMLYASLGILVVACWLISVSQLTPFITRIFFVDGIMGFIFCMMMPFALLIYVKATPHNCKVIEKMI